MSCTDLRIVVDGVVACVAVISAAVAVCVFFRSIPKD